MSVWVNPRGLGVATSAGATAIQQQITSAALAAGVDPALALAVANTESRFNQSAVSGAGAIGIFQLMPATAAELGVDPTNQAQNIQGGVKLLAQLNQQYQGNTALVLAAYNAGPTAVAAYGGVPPYPETQNYVASIMAALGLGTGTSAGTGSVGAQTPLDATDGASAGDYSAATGGTNWGMLAVIAAAALVVWNVWGPE